MDAVTQVLATTGMSYYFSSPSDELPTFLTILHLSTFIYPCPASSGSTQIDCDLLNALLTLLKAELSRSIAFKASVANFLSKSDIAHLPEKVLSTIFEWLVRMTPVRTRLFLPFLLAKINQKWRTVVFQTPALWSVLDIHRYAPRVFTSVIPYFLRNGKQLLVLHSGWDVFFSKQLFKKLCSHCQLSL